MSTPVVVNTNIGENPSTETLAPLSEPVPEITITNEKKVTVDAPVEPLTTVTTTTSTVEVTTAPVASLPEPFNLKSHLCQPWLWIILIVTIVFIILYCFIAYSQIGWYQDLNNYDLAANVIILLIFMIIVGIIMSICTYIGLMAGTPASAAGIMASYILGLVLLLIWFVVFYRSKDLTGAFIVAIVFFAITVIQTYFVWISNVKAGIGMLLYIIGGIVLASIAWYIADKNTVVIE